MNTTEMRSRIVKFVEQADERILRIFHAIIEAEEKNSTSPGHEKPDAPIQHKTYDEKGQEEGMGKPKDDHRLK